MNNLPLIIIINFKNINMKLLSKFNTTPIYGIISKDKKRFSDCDLFKADLWKYAVLTKIKIWWGSPQKSENNIKNKTLLGIQCKYKNIMTGEEKESESHCGILDSNDIEQKEININENDYFNHFYIGFDTFISYIKFTTKNKEVIEFGEKSNEKKVTINMVHDDQMVQCFIGYYNDYGITALGCKFIKRKDYIFLHIMDILRLRHFFKINQNEKEKWLDNNRINQCNLYIKTIAKVCLLPESQFYSIIKYCA